MPIGFLITAGLITLGITASLWPPFRSGPPGLATWFVSAIPNESPLLAFYWMVASTWLALSQGELHGWLLWVAVCFAAVPLTAMPVLVRRSLRACAAIEQALDGVIGPQWRRARVMHSISSGRPFGRILIAPLPLFHPGGTRKSNISYGDAGRRNRLDLFQRREGGSSGPVLIHLHGGGSSFVPGRKSFYAWRLLFRLARQGWVCIERDLPATTCGRLPRRADRRQEAIAWARASVGEYGGDPDRIVLVGAHLAPAWPRLRASPRTIRLSSRGSSRRTPPLRRS